MNAMKRALGPAPLAGPVPCHRPGQATPLPSHRRPQGPARQLALLTLTAAIAATVGLSPVSRSPRQVRADEGPTPTPLPTLSASTLPDYGPGWPRPEPAGLVFHDSSSDAACAQDPGEGAVAGAMVRLKDGYGDILRQQLTNSYGLYDLHDAAVNLAAGTYSLDIVPPSGSGLAFRCAKPGTNAPVQQSPVTIQSPDTVPDNLLVSVGLW